MVEARERLARAVPLDPDDLYDRILARDELAAQGLVLGATGLAEVVVTTASERGEDYAEEERKNGHPADGG